MVQESIPVGCVPPAWKSYVFQFQWPPADVAPWYGGTLPEKVLTGLQTSQPDVASRGSPGLMSRWGGAPHLTCPGGVGDALPCDLSHEVFHVTYPM